MQNSLNMNKYKFHIHALIVFLVGVSILLSCKEDEEVYPRTRLFMPVLNEDLYSENNTIIVNMGDMKSALSYTLEVSRDSFETVLYTIETDTNYVVVSEENTGEELLWYTIYQVRATAHADDSEYDSKISDFGSVRTQKYPSNMGAPSNFDVTDTRARVYWTQSGAEITKIVVYGIDDERFETPLFEFEVTDEDREALEKIISGLTPSTEYQIALYSEDELRGWEIYETKPIFYSGDPNDLIDLYGIDDPEILADTLAQIPEGKIVVLEGGRTYITSDFAFDKSVLIRAGYSFTPSLPIIECSANFNIVASSTIDSIVFRDVRFEGDFGGSYVFNIDQSGSIGEILFDGCEMHSLRGITRIKGGTGTLDKYSIVNSIADSINGYGVISMDTEGWTAGDILLENSTFSKCQYFVVSRTNTNSLTIESCTINEAPEQGRQMLRWRGSDGNNDITNGVSIKNTIWGHGWDMTESGTYAVDGYDGLGNTNFSVVNTYATSDFEVASGKDEIPGFPSYDYSGTADDLWEDPYTTLDFDFEDTGFAGKGNTGDPRWRIGL